jgi:hypothetical protein
VVVRWDPNSRAGAIAVHPARALDLEAMKSLADSVRDWASYQKLAGEPDNVETSSITGTYDWRAYLQEEAELAREREESVVRKPKKAPLPPAPAPTHWYV